MTDQNLPAPAQERPVRAPITTGGTVAALIPQDIEQAYRIASAFAGSGMVPSAFANKPEACFVAIMAGAEVGLPPFQAMQSFAIINGRPSMWGDALVAVIRNQGFTMKEWYVGEGDDTVAHCAITRPDNGEVTLGEFSVGDAKTAGLWKKAGPWQTSPKRMLKMRARAFAIRDGAADVLRGFQVREEVEDYQPIETVSAKAAPVSMRAKLADGAKSPGFDPAHVETETGGAPAAAAEVIQGEATEPHDPVTGEVIDAEAVQVPDNDPPEPRSEAEQKAQLAAAMASLDKPKPEPEPSPAEVVEAQPDPIPDPVEAAQEATLDSADDLIRQNAYDDGFAGEPVDAVLVMCEDEREEAIARAAHAEGHAARIAKEAAEHAASETQAQADADQAANDALDIGGAAPAGTKYLLGTEEPGADGKINLYLDGKVFSRVPSEPALASQGGGTGLPDKSEPEAVPTTVMKPNGLYESFAAKESWLQIKPLLTVLYGSEDFKALSPDDQARTRAHLWGAVVEMRDRTNDPVDHATDPAAFGLWVDWMGVQDQPAQDRIDAIRGTLATLQGGKVWKDRLTDAQRTALEVRVAGVLAKIKGT